MNSPEFSYQHYSARHIPAHRIRIMRAFWGWSQEALAEIAGLHRTYNSLQSLSGAHGAPYIDLINKSEVP